MQFLFKITSLVLKQHHGYSQGHSDVIHMSHPLKFMNFPLLSVRTLPHELIHWSVLHSAVWTVEMYNNWLSSSSALQLRRYRFPASGILSAQQEQQMCRTNPLWLHVFDQLYVVGTLELFTAGKVNGGADVCFHEPVTETQL